MAEYMDYNDVDFDFKDKRKKRNANIRLAIAVLFLVSIVIWVVVNDPKNVRSNFGPVYSSAHSVGETVNTSENEFLKFDSENALDENIIENDKFQEQYPKLYSLIHKTKLEISKDEVYTFDENGYFTIAKTYIIKRQTDSNGDYFDKDSEHVTGEVGVDIYVFGYSTDGGFTVEKPQKISIHYCNRKGDLTPFLYKTNIENESFRLNFYTLSLRVESKADISTADLSINLESGINKKEVEKNYFEKALSVKTVENQDIQTDFKTVSGGTLGDLDLSVKATLKQSFKSADFVISFDDSMYNKFDSFSIKGISSATYKIKVN